MAEKIRISCGDCGATFKVNKILPGKMPACSKCGGSLKLPGPVLFSCEYCGGKAHSESSVPLDAKVPCPQCRKPMRVNHSYSTDTLEGSGNITLFPQESENITIRFTDATNPTPMPENEAATVRFSPNSTGNGAKTVFGENSVGADDSLTLEEESIPRPGLRGKTFGKYRIESEIARGGMGIVYKAFDPDLRRTVALKVLIAGEGATDNTIKRFLREARAAGQLNHSGIVTVHDTGCIEGQHYFTMEFVEGRNLYRIMKDGSANLKEMLEWIIEVCSALEAAHERGIIHRDLKPQNIMINTEGRAQLMDFGLAKDLGSDSIQSMTGEVMGTPAYMSPEQARGMVHEIDHRTDVYSLGVLLYEIVTGRKPFEGDTVFNTIQAVVNDEPTPPKILRERLHDSLNTIILKCMRKDAGLRYQDMDELARDIENYLKGKRISSKPLPLPLRLLRRATRSKATVAVSVGVVAVLVTAIIVYKLVTTSPLDEIRKGISGTPKEREAAIVLLQKLVKEKGLSEEDRVQALQIARDQIGGKSEKAEAVALEIAAAENDKDALGKILAIMINEKNPVARRKNAMQAMCSYKPETAEEKSATLAAMCRISVAENAPDEIRLEAIKKMAELPLINTLETLGKIALDKNNSLIIRNTAISVIGSKASIANRAATDILFKLQTDENPLISAAAENALERTRTQEHIFTYYGLGGATGNAFAGLSKINKMNADRARQIEDLLENPTGTPKKPVSPVDSILPKLRNPEAATRAGAAFDLGTLGDKKAVLPLMQALSDSEPQVRTSAARALVKLSLKHAIPAKEALPLLQSTDASVRENAAFLLGRLEAKIAAKTLAEALGRESEKRTVRVMATALAQIREPSTLGAIATAAETHGGVTAESCIEAMQEFPDDAPAYLLRLLENKSKSIREKAAAALRSITGKDFGTDADKWREGLDILPE